MKLLKAALLASVIAAPAYASGLTPPILDETVIAAKTSSSSGGILIPLLLVVLLAAALAKICAVPVHRANRGQVAGPCWRRSIALSSRRRWTGWCR